MESFKLSRRNVWKQNKIYIATCMCVCMLVGRQVGRCVCVYELCYIFFWMKDVGAAEETEEPVSHQATHLAIHSWSLFCSESLCETTHQKQVYQNKLNGGYAGGGGAGAQK